MHKARHNPFAVERVLSLRYRFVADDWPAFLARLETLDRRGALVGHKGAGKTTLLEDLELRLRERHWNVQRWQLPFGQRRVPENILVSMAGAKSDDFFLLDGVEQLSHFSWRHLRAVARRAGGLVVTSHRPGYLPTLLECRTSPGVLVDCVRRLLGAECALDAAELERLYRRHQGNVRECLRELYDAWAEGE